MKKKIVSVLLAACLFAGTAMPAFAATIPDGLSFSYSSESGDESEITRLAFNKSSYTVKYGESLDLLKELVAYCGSTKICQEPNLEWDMSDTLALGINDDGVVEAFEESGSATITVTAAGKRATCKVVAAKNTSAKATSFKFEQATYTLYTGVTNSKDQTVIKVVPANANGKFSSGQIENLIQNLPLAMMQGSSSEFSFNAEEGTEEDAGKVLLISNGISDEKSASVKLTDYEFPRYDGNGTISVDRSVKINVAKGVEATKILKKTSNIKVEVGQIIDLNDYVVYNTNANYGKECSYQLLPYNDNSDSMDYATLSVEENGRYLQGVAVGKVKVQATLSNTKYDCTTNLTVDVVKANSLSNSEVSLSPTSGSLKVGETLTLTARNASGSNIEWHIDNTTRASLTKNGTTATLKALAIGTVNVTLYADNDKVGTAKITISAPTTSSVPTASAPTTSSAPSSGLKPPANITANPQTGDSLFANLF